MATTPANGDDTGIAELLGRILEKAEQLRTPSDSPIALRADWLRTPVGDLVLVGDDQHLHFLNFLTDEAAMVRKIAMLQKKINADLQPGAPAAIARAKEELGEYFAGQRREFSTPLLPSGTAFQRKVWDALRGIPFGETASYAELANQIGQPSSFRAVAQANSQNPIVVIIPCHRVVNSGGEAGGYSGGTIRKSRLLDFEKGVKGKTEAQDSGT